MIIPRLPMILFPIAQLFYALPHTGAYCLSPLSRGIRRDSSSTCLGESSRRPRNSRYENEGGRGEEQYWEKYSGGSKEERELKDMSFPQETDGDYEETSIARYDDDDEEDFGDYYEDYPDDYPDEVADPGNFWSNPTGGMDRPIQSRRRQGSARQPRPRGYATENRRRPPARRSPVRMNQNSVPVAAKDFYERLFWYGFDADETEGVGDKTVFGGTKGKFNGLSYMEASETGPYEGPNRRPRRRYDAYYEEDSDIDGYDYDEEYLGESQARPRSMKPPTDAPYPRRDSPAERKRKTRRQESFGYGDRNDSENPGDWVSKSVSSWFTGDDKVIGDGDDELDDRSRRRRKRKQSSEWSPFNVMDAFFGVDRDEMQYKADLYNQKMGLGKNRRSYAQDGIQERSNRQTPRRPGYAYKYEEEDSEESNPVVDLDIVSPEEDNNKPAEARNTAAEVRPPRQRREKSWEERALAVERVPPANIPAWGPSGEMPCDARTKAIMDALEDLETARQKLAKREKKEALASEEITILKVDAELQRRKLRTSGSDPFLAKEQLRQIEFEMDDASRELRRARTSTEIAREQLERFEERHWALLRFYNPDQAKQQVQAALLELEEREPAARMPNSGNFVESVEANGSGNSSQKPSTL